MQLPSLNIEEIETAIASLYQNEDPELDVWTEHRGLTAFCAEAALLQFVITWARKKGKESVANFQGLSADSEDFEQSLQRSLGNPHVVAAWVLATNLTDENSRGLKRIEAKGYNRYLDAMDSFDFPLTGNNSTNLICIQGGLREYIRPLYEEEKGIWKVKPEGEIRAMIQDIVARLTSEWSVKYLREVCEPLSHLTRELVENSDWWARINERGVLYERGIRAINFRLIEVDTDNVISFAGANDNLKAYLTHCLTNDEHSRPTTEASRANASKKLSFIELSVVDSGPGLTRRWLASRPGDRQLISDLSDISIEDEETALIECFKKWRTSSANSLRGIGLFSVARLLKKKNGFMRLRSGRHSYMFGTQSAIMEIERRLKNERKGQDISDYERLRDGTHVFLENKKMTFFLKPWTETKLEQVEGTSYSILLPV